MGKGPAWAWGSGELCHRVTSSVRELPIIIKCRKVRPQAQTSMRLGPGLLLLDKGPLSGEAPPLLPAAGQAALGSEGQSRHVARACLRARSVGAYH
jgi:hypothetical protein